MNQRWNEAVAAAGPLAQLALAVAGAALAGVATAVAGSLAGYRTLYFVAVFGLVVTGSVVAATRPEPLRFVFLALILAFPVASALVPPGRYGFTVFDLVMLALTIGLIGKRIASADPGERLFPTNSLSAAWLISVPCVVFSRDPWLSLQLNVLLFAGYGFFLYALRELRQEGGLERLSLLFSIVLLCMAAGLLADHFLHVNLSLRGSNLNQLTYSFGREIYRAGGFFQDPQKGGAFNATLITFLLILAVRGRFRAMTTRVVVWLAIAAGLVSLMTTISRAAMASCLLVSAIAIFVLNRWNAASKLLVTAGLVLAVLGIALTPADTWLSVLPATVVERIRTTGAELDNRIMIWFDTWEMFANHPLTGIGPGTFQDYLLATRPTVFDYYGIGAGKGVMYVPDNPESGYFKILYEGGIAGSLAALLLVGDALRRALNVATARAAGADARSEALAALSGLFTLGLTFVTLTTLSDQRMLAILAFFLAVIWHRSLQHAQAAPEA
jgi:O-antigen ligase